MQVSDSQVALLSQDILGYGAFKSDSIYSKHPSYVDWLKKFEKAAFSASEKKALLKSPIDYYNCPEYAFVYTKMDAKNFLQKYLPAAPTSEVIADIQNNPKLSDFDKRGYTNSISSGYWLHSRDMWSELTVNRVKRNDAGKWEVLTLNKVTNDDFTVGIRPAILVDRKILAQQAPTQAHAPSQQQIDNFKMQLEERYNREIHQRHAEEDAQNKKAAKKNGRMMFLPMLVTGIGLHLILAAIAYMQSLILPILVLAAGIGLWVRFFIKKSRYKDTAKHKFLKLCSILLLIVLLLDTIAILRYIPLRKSIISNSISSSYDLNTDRGALKVIASQLEKYHKNNDVDSALELYTLLVQRNVHFDRKGNYLVGWYSYATWVYEEVKKQGTPIENRNAPYIDATYEYHGYKIAFYETYDGTGCRAFDLFVEGYPDDDGWCYIDFSYKDFGNIIYHIQNGGIMFD